MLIYKGWRCAQNLHILCQNFGYAVCQLDNFIRLRVCISIQQRVQIGMTGDALNGFVIVCFANGIGEITVTENMRCSTICNCTK